MSDTSSALEILAEEASGAALDVGTFPIGTALRLAYRATREDSCSGGQNGCSAKKADKKGSTYEKRLNHLEG